MGVYVFVFCLAFNVRSVIVKRPACVIWWSCFPLGFHFRILGSALQSRGGILFTLLSVLPISVKEEVLQQKVQLNSVAVKMASITCRP